MEQQSFTGEIPGSVLAIPGVHETRLTSSEISSLWQEQMYYSMLGCFLRYFVNHVEEPGIRTLLEDQLRLAEERVTTASDIFRREGLVTPRGFTDEDVDVNAPRLFSDEFYLYYIKNLIPAGLSINTMGLSRATRGDVRAFYHRNVESTMRMWQNTADLLQGMGLLVKPPCVTVVNQSRFVKEQEFLGGFLVERRPLLAVEIDNLFFTMITNNVGKALLTGYHQVARSGQVRRYIDRGKAITEKIIDLTSSILRKEDISAPLHWNLVVTDSTTTTFSDRLIMYHLLMLNKVGLIDYSFAMSSSLRHDLSVGFTRLMTEVMNYSEDGANIMIQNGWFEQPPMVVNRRELVNEPKH